MPERESEAIGAAIRAATADVHAPGSLRAQVAAQRLAERPPARRGRALAGLGAAAAAGLAAVALAVLPGSAGDPSVADAARAALAAPEAPAPAVDGQDPRFVAAAVGGVRFPNYGYDAGWRAVGARAERLSGRSARTVVYARGSTRVGYTIVAGDRLATPSGARAAKAGATPVTIGRRGAALVVSWERGGHTCVLASRTATAAQLLAFVTWRDVT